MTSCWLLKVYHILNRTLDYAKPQCAAPVLLTISSVAVRRRSVAQLQIALLTPVADRYKTFVAAVMEIVSALSLFRYSIVMG